MTIFTVFLVGLSIHVDSLQKPSNFLLDEITVIAQRSEQKVFNTMGAVSVLTANNLQKYQFRTTPESLAGVNGVFIQKTNHGGGSLFLRGLTGNQTLMLIDGIRLNNSTFRYGPNQYLNTIDPFSIQNIEVYKGGGAVQYGSDALGGTIQLRTIEPAFAKNIPTLNTNAVFRIGTDKVEKTFHTDMAFATQRLAMRAGLSARNFGDLMGGNITGIQAPSGYNEIAFDTKGRFKLTNTITLTAAHQSLKQLHVPLYHKVVLENFLLNEISLQERNLSYLQINALNTNKLLKNITINISYQSTNEIRNSQKNGTTIERIEQDQVGTLGSFLAIKSVFTNHWSATSGLEFYSDKVKSTKQEVQKFGDKTTNFRGLYPDGSTFQSYGLYSLHQLTKDRWHIDFGMRFNGYQIKIMDETVGLTNLSPQALIGNIALGYQYADKSMMYVAYNTGFRAPNIDDMGTLGIVDFRYEVPTSSLQPEKSYNVELGYKFKSRIFSTNLALYHTQLRNLITRVKVEGEQIKDYQVYRKENVEKAYIQGFEWGTEWFISPQIKAYTDLTYTYGQNQTKNEPVRRIPPLTGRIGVHYQVSSQFYVKIEDLFADKQSRLAQGDKDDNRIAVGGTNGWNIINLYAGYDYKNIALIGSFQNIFDIDYRTHGSGINGIGRSLITTFIYRF